MKIYVIRHGQTLWNAQGRLQGAADIPLNDNGTRLARITGQALKEVPFFLLFYQPFKKGQRYGQPDFGGERCANFPGRENSGNFLRRVGGPGYGQPASGHAG